MKVSFVATVFNEEKTVGKFIESILQQTKLPDEVIVVDGGSTDSTLSVISNIKYQISNKKIKLRFFSKQDLTIAQGRNYGIEKAAYDIIAMSDAGCVLHKDWCEKITKPFISEDADIVAGFYCMTGSSSIQKALAVYLGIVPQRFDYRRFLPSARSMALKKSLWRNIGGFDEKLDRAGEDTLFNYQAIKMGVKFVRVKGALVDWEIPASFWEGLKKFFIYARGDIQAGIWWHPLQRISTHNLKIFNIMLRYSIGFGLSIFSFKLFLIAALAYLIWPIWKMRHLVIDFKTKLWLPFVQVGSDIAVLSGTSLGILKRRW